MPSNEDYVRFIRKNRGGMQQRMLNVLTLLTLLSVGFSLVLFYMITNPEESKYFSTTINGESKPLVASDIPHQSDKAITEFASLAVVAANTLNFLTAEDHYKKSRPFFTRAGWEQYTLALQSSNILNEIQAKGLIVTAVVVRPPIILQKGPLNGVYSWRVQLVVLITYSASVSRPTVRLPVTMLIQRTSTLDTIQGIGISEFTVGRQLLGST